MTRCNNINPLRPAWLPFLPCCTIIASQLIGAQKVIRCKIVLASKKGFLALGRALSKAATKKTMTNRRKIAFQAFLLRDSRNTRFHVSLTSTCKPLNYKRNERKLMQPGNGEKMH